MTWFLFVLIIFIIFFKWFFFILCIIPIKIMFRIKTKSKKNEKVEETTVKEFKQPNSISKSIKILINKYFLGYIRYMDIQTGQIPSHRIRNFLYKRIWNVTLADKAVIYYGAEIRSPYNLKIGKGSIIGDKAILDARRGGIVIGDNVCIGTGVSMWTDQHDYNDPYFRSMPNKRGPIVIHDRVWIGPGVTILHNVTIGEGAVVAAGAVVTKNIPPFTLVGGIPAKVIAKRNEDLRYEFDGSHLPFY